MVAKVPKASPTSLGATKAADDEPQPTKEPTPVSSDGYTKASPPWSDGQLLAALTLGLTTTSSVYIPAVRMTVLSLLGGGIELQHPLATLALASFLGAIAGMAGLSALHAAAKPNSRKA